MTVRFADSAGGFKTRGGKRDAKGLLVLRGLIFIVSRGAGWGGKRV